MKPLLPLLAAMLVLSCGKEKDLTLLSYELNTAGIKHKVLYEKGLPREIIYELYHGSRSRDTTMADTVLKRINYHVKYDGSTALLAVEVDKPLRKYYFNSDNLLTKITRFDGKSEYVTDSVTYNYMTRTVLYYDVINKHVFELVYDNKNNIETATERRMSDQHVFSVYYYYYDASRNPFLVNLDEDEELFGCFNYRTVGLFWNNGSRPVFSSKNNVQSFKKVDDGEERNGLFEYQYRKGLPLVQFGNDGVIYYHYKREQISK